MLDSKSGFSLLELMAVVLLIAIVAMMTMPLLQEQIAAREIETIARRFIAHAHFARQQALYLGQPVRLAPIADDRWESGWVVKSGCIGKAVKSGCIEKSWFLQGGIDPIYFKGGGKQFIDPNSGKKSILFNAAGAAKTAQGGFVANRLILGHSRAPDLERQMILGSGGRWRICDPARDTKRCH
ncbi:GspH/FimT family pseudopilin [Polynucleobacter sp. MWH-S4W17]|uniref:GspH/FimT family pseudopilin n=1 Tax=Polynucleobacter sp. MWH-S4W17 TaxID=1855910 RepID=UPI001BFE1689|nr:GspH/FimT family pseudopilin [Polynucleobacter sp. MWH-S4W17]QWD81876.1 GspH/FimT family pseudopilin [Polynucleobacter sp. MWH-S4W17]